MATVELFFDPTCPWTWNTSRWLCEATARRGDDIAWRSLSLPILNTGREIPERFRAGMDTSRAAHRVFAALRAAGRNDLVGALYTELGRRLHHDGAERSPATVAAAVEAAGAGEWAGAADDPSWDAEVEASTKEAVGLAGPDVGSPVLAFGGGGDDVGDGGQSRHAFFGPIVSPPPTGDAAAALYDAVRAAGAIEGFYELKRGRQGGPQFGPRP